MTTKNLHGPPCVASLTEVAKVEKIVDYSFERNEKSNVLAIHPTRPLIAYLINIQRTQKISKAWTSANESIQSPPLSSINGQGSLSNISDKNKTVSIRIIDYVTRQRCLAKGIYHARPVDCVFTINSTTCLQMDIIKLAVVDKLANVYLYDIMCTLTELSAARIAVIRGPMLDVSPYEYINIVWCPFVPCEDFDDGDGGLRLGLATDNKIEIFAIDRIQGKTGELQRKDLKGAYKCINDAHKSDIVTLSISPDCSTISAAALDNRITFFSSDIEDSGQRCLHNWKADMIDSPIAKLFFLDNYPRLLEDSTMLFWGAAFIGTTSGQMLLIDLSSWEIYQTAHLCPDATGPRNFDYRIDLTARNIVAVNVTQCYVIRIDHEQALSSSQSSTISDLERNQDNPSRSLDSPSADIMNGNIFNYLLSKSSTATPRSNQKTSTKKNMNNNTAATNSTSIGGSGSLPRIVKTLKLSLHTPIYSFVIKHKSSDEIELFTISAYSLELYIINLIALEVKMRQLERATQLPPQQPRQPSIPQPSLTPNQLQLQQQHQTLQQQHQDQYHQQQQHKQQQQQQQSQLLQLQQLQQQQLHQHLHQLQQYQQQQPQQPLHPLQQPLHQPQQLQQLSQAQILPQLLAQDSVVKSTEARVSVVSDANQSYTHCKPDQDTITVNVNQMDRMVEVLFSKLNTSFSQGLEEFLSEIKCEVNDLKSKLNGLSRDVGKLQQQLHDIRQK